VRAKRLTPLRMVELLSLAPARILGIDDVAGSLRNGRHGDFVLFDPKATFTFDPSHVRSAARNSPFFGRKMAGRVRATAVAGTVVFEAFKEKK
jgi:dihydroorotase